MNIKEKYSQEILSIQNDLSELERGLIYEIQKTPGTPKASTLANRLTEKLNDLLYKIENNKKSTIETIAEALKK